MAVSQIAITQIASGNVYLNTSVNATKDQVKASSTVVYMIEVDNSANGAQANWLKLYNLTSGNTTVGTSTPDMIVFLPAAAKYNLSIPQGVTFGTALTIACVSDNGGTSGTTNPGAAVIARIVYV